MLDLLLGYQPPAAHESQHTIPPVTEDKGERRRREGKEEREIGRKG